MWNPGLYCAHCACVECMLPTYQLCWFVSLPQNAYRVIHSTERTMREYHAISIVRLRCNSSLLVGFVPRATTHHDSCYVFCFSMTTYMLFSRLWIRMRFFSLIENSPALQAARKHLSLEMNGTSPFGVNPYHFITRKICDTIQSPR
ncbi:hypothetical protein BDR05DRAFT_221888 [Suillus weaverae]|nr:hypothetical protein BDR05DRAFT_221888 [Suillus weaverae]